MTELADRIANELRALVGHSLAECSRAANMVVFGFGPKRRTINREGKEIELCQFRLHIQCRWRFCDNDHIIFGRDDISYPSNESIPLDEFDWNTSASVFDMKQRDWFAAHQNDAPIVTSVLGDRYGGFTIYLASGLQLSCFPCDSQSGEYSEHWRFFGHRVDDSHFVVTGSGVEER